MGATMVGLCGLVELVKKWNIGLCFGRLLHDLHGLHGVRIRAFDTMVADLCC